MPAMPWIRSISTLTWIVRTRRVDRADPRHFWPQAKNALDQRYLAELAMDDTRDARELHLRHRGPPGLYALAAVEFRPAVLVAT
jgi:hypothetical protein